MHGKKSFEIHTSVTDIPTRAELYYNGVGGGGALIYAVHYKIKYLAGPLREIFSIYKAQHTDTFRTQENILLFGAVF